MEASEQFWKIALSVAGLASIASFVLWSLYKQWLKLPIFTTLTKQQQYKLLRLFLVLTFLFSVLALAAYVIEKRDVTGTDAVQIIPMENKDALVASFSAYPEALESGDTLTFKFQSVELGLDFEFEALLDAYPHELLNAFVEHFRLKDHVKIEQAKFPTGLSKGAWYQDWKLLRNGAVEGNEYYQRDDETFADLGARDGDLITLKVAWGLSTLISKDGLKTNDTRVLQPPEIPF